MIGWIIFWVVIAVIAVFAGATIGDSDVVGGIIGLGLIITVIGLPLQQVLKDDNSKQNKLTPEIQATIIALKEAKAQAEQLASLTPVPTPEPLKYGVEVYIDPASDYGDGNNKIGKVICIEKMLVKANVYTTDGYYYRIEPECNANRKYYRSDLYVSERAIKAWEQKDNNLTICQCEGGY